MKLLRAAFVALFLALAPAVSFADAVAGPVVTVQTAPASGLTVPAATPDSTTTTVTTAPASVKIPWGDWLDAAINQIVIPILGVVILGLITFIGARISPFLPSWLRGMVNAKNAAALDQLLTPAIATGLQKVGANVQGQTLDANLGSQAANTATQYAIDHAPQKLIDWAGGPAAIQQKIEGRIAMLNTGVTAQATATTPTVKTP